MHTHVRILIYTGYTQGGHYHFVGGENSGQITGTDIKSAKIHLFKNTGTLHGESGEHFEVVVADNTGGTISASDKVLAGSVTILGGESAKGAIQVPDSVSVIVTEMSAEVVSGHLEFSKHEPGSFCAYATASQLDRIDVCASEDPAIEGISQACFEEVTKFYTQMGWMGMPVPAAVQTACDSEKTGWDSSAPNAADTIPMGCKAAVGVPCAGPEAFEMIAPEGRRLEMALSEVLIVPEAWISITSVETPVIGRVRFSYIISMPASEKENGEMQRLADSLQAPSRRAAARIIEAVAADMDAAKMLCLASKCYIDRDTVAPVMPYKPPELAPIQSALLKARDAYGHCTCTKKWEELLFETDYVTGGLGK